VRGTKQSDCGIDSHTPAVPVVGIPTGRTTKSPVQGRRARKGERMSQNTQPQKAVTELQLKAALEPITREINDMRYDLAEMKKVVTGNGSGIGLDEQARNNRRDIDKHEKDLIDTREFVKGLQPIIIFYKVGVWFAGLIGASIVALIWGLLTGQVVIGTP